jgi:hypothetical protein
VTRLPSIGAIAGTNNRTVRMFESDPHRSIPSRTSEEYVYRLIHNSGWRIG